MSDTTTIATSGNATAIAIISRGIMSGGGVVVSVVVVVVDDTVLISVHMFVSRV